YDSENPSGHAVSAGQHLHQFCSNPPWTNSNRHSRNGREDRLKIWSAAPSLSCDPKVLFCPPIPASQSLLRKCRERLVDVGWHARAVPRLGLVWAVLYVLYIRVGQRSVPDPADSLRCVELLLEELCSREGAC